MNGNTAENVRLWVSRAETDWISVEILAADERCPCAAVCFHCQQYVEKLLQALLTRHHIEAPRTHDLRRLIQLAAPFAAALVALADRADALSVHGVQTRYPDDLRVIDQTEMREMMQLADEFADVLLPLLPEA